jgi:hypothetical protein
MVASCLAFIRIILLLVVFTFVLFLPSLASFGEESSKIEIPVYTTVPTFYDWVPNTLRDVPHYLKRINPVEKWPQYLGIIGSSALLIKYDQEILDESKRVARQMKLVSDNDEGNRSKRYYVGSLAGIKADLCLPDGPNSYLYFLGDGLTSFGVIGGLALYGNMHSDVRALNTASQVMESMALTGIFVITSKYTFGREAPFRATKEGGVWRPMPGLKNYLSAVSRYDAFPSGHVATLMSTFKIVEKNYPEKFWIKPVGYGSLGLLMFAMMNNGVHWAGDYPLGLAIGYVAADTVFDLNKPESKLAAYKKRSGWDLNMFPLVSSDSFGMMLDLKY